MLLLQDTTLCVVQMHPDNAFLECILRVRPKSLSKPLLE